MEVVEMTLALLHCPAETTRCLPPGTTLVLNADQRIVTLTEDGRRIRAQCRLSLGSFRLLTLLIKSPEGSHYAEMFACLHCPDIVFEQVWREESVEQVRTILLPYTNHWQDYLSQVSARSVQDYEREVKMLRRLVKEKDGIHDKFHRYGFEVIVHTLYKRGYVLLPARQAQQKKQVREYIGSTNLAPRVRLTSLFSGA
jgi:hypothetical protein